MDFRNWKKKCEDGKSCTLVHPQGHTMNIAVKALPKILQEQIKRLSFAEGGKIESEDVLKSGKGGTSSQGSDVRHKAMDDAKSEAKGRAQIERMTKPKMKGLAKGGRVNYDEGTPDDTVQSDNSSSQGPHGNHTPITINVGAPAATQAQPMPTRQPAQAPQSQANNQTMLPDQTINAPAAVQKQQEAIQEQAPIDIAKAKAAAQNEGEMVDTQQAIAQANANAFKELKEHTDDFNGYIQNNPINPKAYQENMSTTSKVATGIGLFLGGMGTPFGGHNYAMDFLNKQIDRDIEGQKARADQQKTVWGAYKDLYGENNIATSLAKVSANDILVHKTNLAAAQLGTPQAMQAAKALQAQKAIENNQLLIDSAGRLGTLRTGGGMPKQGGQAPGAPQKGAANGKDWYEDHVLSPDADRIGMGLQFNKLAQPNLAGIQEQKAKADLADKALTTINEKFPALAKETSQGGYARNHLEPFVNTIPFVGGSLGSAVHTFTDSPKNRNYDSDKSAIVGAVRGALQGNVSDQLLDETVNANIPELNDSSEISAKKIKTLKEFIKSHTKTDLLRPLRMTKE